MDWRLMTAVVVGAIVVAATLWLIIFPSPSFPAPSGPYSVGTRLYEMTDASRPEPFTPAAGDRRHLTIRVWYPSSDAGDRLPYIERPEVLAALASRLHVPPLLLGRLQNAPTHSSKGAEPQSGPFPVLFNPTGFSGFHTANLFWIEELVSQGYVVVTIDQPGTSAAAEVEDGSILPMIDKAVFDGYMPLALSQITDPAPVLNGVPLPGGIIPFLAEDLSFVLDRLSDIDPELNTVLDLDRVGVFGISLGGYAGPEACRLDDRFKACLAVDAGKTALVAENGLSQPVMMISRDADVMRQERGRAGGWPEDAIEHTIGDQRALFANNRGDAYLVTMNGMFHVNWTDAPLWSPLVRWLGLAGPIEPYLGFAATNACSVAFFDRYLKSKPSTELCPRAGDRSAITRFEQRSGGRPAP